MEKINIRILNNYFMKDGKFDRDAAIDFCGKIAGVCYSKAGYSTLEHESSEKTERRVDLTINNGHHSVYDHVVITLYIENIPKIMATILNNENEYTTSEKSLRYTPVIKNDNSILSDREIELYNKWLEIFKLKIKESYGDVYDDLKIKKLAQENARYLITIFVPTKMVYTTSLRQINYIASWLKDYCKKSKCNYMNNNLSGYIEDFIKELDRLNIIDPRLMHNEKHRNISLFNDKIDDRREYFGDVYCINYNASWAYLAQANRHRTLDYQMKRLDNPNYYVPPILKDNYALVNEWLNDISSVSNIIPQGELVRINEMGSYDNFILKCKERLCSSAQLEIMQKTYNLLINYKFALDSSEHPLSKDIVNYTRGMKCTFPDYKCTNPTCRAKIKKFDRKI